MHLEVNARVRVTGAAGEVLGRVEEIRPAAEVPDISGFDMEAGRKAFAALGVSRVAFISYYVASNCGLMFAALEIDGKWFDLLHQELTIEVVGMFGCVVSPN